MNDMPRHGWLPALLAEIAQVAGLDAALKLAEARGGTEVYIPATATDGHWLVETVGRSAANAICAHFTVHASGCRLELPLGPAGTAAQLRRQIDRMIAEGRSEREIALAAGYTGRGIRLRKAKIKADTQDGLFSRNPEAVPGRAPSRK